MADTATTASEKTSNKAESDHVLQRLEALSNQYEDEGRPESDFVYYVKDEEEAGQILLAMAAAIKLTVRGVNNKADRVTYLNVAHAYTKAVNDGQAHETFRTMTEEDQLELYGLKLLTHRIFLQ